MNIRTFSVTVVAAIVAAGVAASVNSQEPRGRVEVIVFNKRPNQITFTDMAGTRTPFRFSGYLPILVREERDGRFRIHDGFREGWVAREDFLIPEVAGEFFREARTKRPDDPWLLLMCAVAAMHQAKDDEAIKLFEEYLGAHPKDDAAYVFRSMVWRLKGENGKALDDLVRAIGMNPKNANAFHERGSLWRARGKFDEAIRDFDEAVRLAPGDTNPLYDRGRVWKQKNDLDRAIRDFDEVLRLDGNDVYALGQRGLTFLEKENIDRAIRDFDESIRIAPRDVLGYLNRGQAWSRKKMYDKALGDFSKAIVIAPNDSGAHNFHAWLLATCPNADIRDGKKAVESARRAVELRPSDGNAMDTLAAAHAEAGDFREAIRWQQKALSDPNRRDDPEYVRRLRLYEMNQPYRQP